MCLEPAIITFICLPLVERPSGIEPESLAWKAKVLPLNYGRIEAYFLRQGPGRDLYCLRYASAVLPFIHEGKMQLA